MLFNGEREAEFKEANGAKSINFCCLSEWNGLLLLDLDVEALFEMLFFFVVLVIGKVLIGLFLKDGLMF